MVRQGEINSGRDDRVLTVPNLISFARLAGIGLFLYLFLAADEPGWAVVVLAVAGASDWVDGYLARRLGQVSRLGELLDPLVDRLYIIAILLAFTIRDVVPWQFTVILLARDVMLLATLPAFQRIAGGPPPVVYVGKLATFVLLFALPAVLLAWATSGITHAIAYPAGWSLAWWGLGLYWLAGFVYMKQFFDVLRARRFA